MKTIEKFSKDALKKEALVTIKGGDTPAPPPKKEPETRPLQGAGAEVEIK